MALQHVIERLKAEVGDLHGHVHGSTSFSDLIKRGAQVVAGQAAYVLPSTVTGGGAQHSASTTIQDITRGVGIVLVVQGRGTSEAKVTDELDELVEATLAALVGWEPEAESVGVLVLQSGQLIPIGNGFLGYQLEFTYLDQLRITS